MSRCHSEKHVYETAIDPDSSFINQVGKLKSSTSILKRIPRGARTVVAQKLSNVINLCVSRNTVEAWQDLFLFSFRILHVPPKMVDNKSLTSKVKENVNNFELPKSTTVFGSRKTKQLSKIAEVKLGDGDVRGAIRVLTSGEKLADDNSDTFKQLKDKHPSPSRPLIYPAPPNDDDISLSVTEENVLRGIMSFPNGSAAGIDGLLRPQHLKDLVGKSVGDYGQQLLISITRLCNFMLSGKVNSSVTTFLYGASLTALSKKDGGIRPIAIGCTFRRLVSKLGCHYTSSLLSTYLKPFQLGVAVKSGCEALVHAVRSYVFQDTSAEILVKIDVKNAFNSIERDMLLQNVKDTIPELYPYLWQCYSSPSDLFYNQKCIQSSVGCQQGDPLGPAIFSLAIHPFIKKLKSKLNVWYLDDGTLGGSPLEVFKDLESLITDFKSVGLILNFSKCELYFCRNYSKDKVESIHKRLESLAPGIRVTSTTDLCFLDSPLTEEAFPSVASKLLEKFSCLSNNLSNINSHMALFLLRNCFWIPKLNYFLRCFPFWKYQKICESFDNTIRNTLQNLLNIQLTDNCWNQASLPVRLGGLGIRSISDLSLPAFLASVHCTSNLIGLILNSNVEIQYKAEALNFWKTKHPELNLPTTPNLQKNWDAPLMQEKFEFLLSRSHSPHRAVLLASSQPESGAWLNALPSAPLGTLLDKQTLQIAVSLRIGSNICHPHTCICGSSVNCLGHHGLSCSKSSGRFSRHSAINNILKRALASIDIPSVLEPCGLFRTDGKRPDGMSLIPWKKGRSLVWDVTCVDTVAASHIQNSCLHAGSASASAASLKHNKYVEVKENYEFVAFAVETMGTWSAEAKRLWHEIGSLLYIKTGVRQAKLYLQQQISLAIQRGNAASVLGTLPRSTGMGEIFYLN